MGKKGTTHIRKIWKHQNLANIPIGQQKWITNLNLTENEDWKYLYNLAENCKLNATTIFFQYQMLHRTIMTNRKLCQFNLRPNELCDDCQVPEDGGVLRIGDGEHPPVVADWAIQLREPIEHFLCSLQRIRRHPILVLGDHRVASPLSERGRVAQSRWTEQESFGRDGLEGHVLLRRGGDNSGNVEAELRVDVVRLRIVLDELGRNADHVDDC